MSDHQWALVDYSEPCRACGAPRLEAGKWGASNLPGCATCGAPGGFVGVRAMQAEILRDLWSGDIKVSPEQRRWIRQALDAQDHLDE